MNNAASHKINVRRIFVLGQRKSESSIIYIPHNPVEGFAFDMDGTLVDCEPYNRAAVQAAAGERFPIAWDVNAGRKEYLIHEWLCAKYPKFNKPLEEFVADCHKGYQARLHLVEARDGMARVLRYIQKQGLPMIVVTNTPHDLAVARLELTNLSRYFNQVVGSDTVTNAGKNPKPSSDPYLLAAEILGIHHHKIGGFEDSPTGVESLIRSGLVSVQIHDYGDRPSRHVDYHVDGQKPAQLMTVVKALCGDEKAQTKARSFFVPEPGSTPHP
jgi:beta-phosphoglucomutase-like phosphatase (HAD superfamily)